MASAEGSEPAAPRKSDTLVTYLERIRLAHAKELLGKRYSKSVVRKGEGQNTSRFERFIREWTRQSLKKSGYKGRANQVASAIIKNARKHELDPLFVMAVIQNESGFNAKARGQDGEIGLMQLMPDTARQVAKKLKMKWKGDKKMLEDPATNIALGTEYLSQLRARFDNHGQLYLAAYNMGAKNVRRALARAVRPKDYPLRVMVNYIGYYTKLSGRPKKESHTPDVTLPPPPETATIDPSEAIARQSQLVSALNEGVTRFVSGER